MSPAVRTRPRPRRRPRRRAAVTKADPTALVLVGSSPRADQVEAALGRLDIEVARSAELPETIDPGALGVVIVTPLALQASAELAVARLRADPSSTELPVFAVIDDETSDRAVRTIYASGATAVFHWPREALLFPRLIAELLGVALVRGRTNKPQTALGRTVRAHLRLLPGSTHGVRVAAAGGGQVSLSGSIASFRRKRELLRMVARVPGVTLIDSRCLSVEPSDLTDRQVAAAVRSTLRHTVDDGTVSVSVDGGVVSLAGTVPDRSVLTRIDDVVSHVAGVRGIENALVVSDRIQRKDGATARRLTALLQKWFPRESVAVSVFARVAVISGRVRGLHRSLEIAQLVDQDPAISRVINKLDVA